MFKALRRFFRSSSALTPTFTDVDPRVRTGMRVSLAAVALAGTSPGVEAMRAPVPIEPPAIAPGVLPAGADRLAMDSGLSSLYQYANTAYGGLGFVGYPFLAELSQRPEYRRGSEIIASEVTRKWIKFVSSGDDDKTAKIARLKAAFRKFKVQAHFRKLAEHDGLFGRGQIYIDVNTPRGTVASADPEELKTILIRSPAKIKKGSLRGFKVIEAMWTYPNRYNSINPLAPDYFKPQSWFVMGSEVHSSRLLTIITREMPDMLKPAYNFGGMSLSQLAMPYVDNWLRARTSVSELLYGFSTTALKTDLSSILNNGAGEDLFHRIDIMQRTRANRQTVAIDKESEELVQLNVPISGIDKLQAQAQEQMCAVMGIPLVKFTGITPSGLNASSDGEIRVFYDSIHSMQEAHYSDALSLILEVVQLSEFGEIDPEIGFEWEPLYELDGEALSRVRKSDGDRDAAYVAAGILAPEEVRASLAADPQSGYNMINVDQVPEPPEPEAPPAPGDE